MKTATKQLKKKATKPVNVTPLASFLNYDIERTEDGMVIFGCGDVKVKRSVLLEAAELFADPIGIRVLKIMRTLCKIADMHMELDELLDLTPLTLRRIAGNNPKTIKK